MELGDILKDAFDGVAAELDGVIKTVVITRQSPGTFDPETGVRSTTSTLIQEGRAVVENESAIPNAFPGYVVSGGERLVLLQGLEWAPREGDKASVQGLSVRTVKAVVDFLAAGQGFRVILQ